MEENQADSFSEIEILFLVNHCWYASLKRDKLL